MKCPNPLDVNLSTAWRLQNNKLLLSYHAENMMVAFLCVLLLTSQLSCNLNVYVWWKMLNVLGIVAVLKLFNKNDISFYLYKQHGHRVMLS